MPTYKRRRTEGPSPASYKGYGFRQTVARSKFRTADAMYKNRRTGGYLGISNEVKFYDTSLVNGALLAAAAAAGGEHNPSADITLNTVPQGQTESSRIGRQIRMKSIEVKGQINIPAQTNQTATDSNAEFFIALVLDTQTNGALLNSEDVFKNQSGAGTLACSVMRNLEFIQRFQVLKLHKFRMPQATVVYDGTNIEQGGLHKDFDFKINLKNLVVNYCGTTAVVANIVDNNLCIIAYASHVSWAPLISYNARLRYTG